jgi:Mg-chelatase subunit ChlD
VEVHRHSHARPRSHACSYAGSGKAGRKIYVEKDDFRAKLMSRKAGGLVVFVVDASGERACYTCVCMYVRMYVCMHACMHV